MMVFFLLVLLPLILITLTLLIPTLVTYAIYCYDSAYATGQTLTAMGARVLRAAAGNVLASARLTLLFPLGLRRRLWSVPARNAESPKALVVMVHGIFHNATAWVLYRRWCHARGYATACFSYSSWNTDLERLAAELTAFVQALHERYPQRDIYLLGHSLGGLLLRMAASDLPKQARALVTIGTPFGGSRLAPFAFNSVGQFLRYDCEAVREVARRPFPARIRALALWSALDNMVVPTKALRCPPAGWSLAETPPVSHMSMLYSRTIFTQALSWLEQSAPDELKLL